MLLKLLLITIITIVYGFNFNENSSENNLKAIHIKKLYPTKVFCRRRTIEFNIALEPIEVITKELETNINYLQKICKITNYSRLCQYSIDEIKLATTKLKNRLKLVESFQVKKLQSDRFRRNINDILQKSVTLSDYSYSDLKQGLEQIKSVVSLFEKMKKESSTHTDHLNFILIFQVTNAKIQKRLEYYNTILNVLTAGDHKEIFSLIPIEMIKTELTSMEYLLNAEYCEFAIKLENVQVINLVNRAIIRSEITTNNLNIKIDLPTFFKGHFDLISAISIPFCYKNSTYEIRPLTPFFLTNYDKIKDVYHIIPFTSENKQNCTTLGDEIICFPDIDFQVFTSPKQKIPDYLFSPTYKLCDYKDIKTLEELNVIPLECDIKRIPHINKLIQLDYSKYYLYLTRTTSVTFDCFKIRTTYNISKPIVINDFKPECSVQFDDGYHPDTKTAYFNSVSLTTYVFNTQAISERDLIKKELPRENTLNSIRNLQPEFSDLHEKIKNIPKKHENQTPNHPNNKKIIVLLAIAICFAIILWIIVIYFLINLKRKTQKEFKNLRNNSPFSTNFPDMHCSFKFDSKPPLPPKTRTPSRTPQDDYDIPKFPARKLETKIIEKAVIHYASIAKNDNKETPI